MSITPTAGSISRLATTAVIVSLALVAFVPHVAAQAPVDLRSAEPFAILAGSTVTNTGPSVIDGDIGLHPGSAVTGFGAPATVHGEIHIGDAVAERAKVNLTAAYVDAAARPTGATLPAGLGGMELVPGVYASETGKFGITGVLTLNAEGDPNATWIFQMDSTLITAVDSSVVLIQGAQACNVFWQVGSSATLDTRTAFQGTIMAQASVSLNDEATLAGRALARDGAVTLINNVITTPTCADDELPSGDDTNAAELVATANPDTSITLRWSPIEGAEAFRIYRAVGDGDMVLHGQVDGDTTTFLDTDTESGQTYRYEVRPIIDGAETDAFDVAEITSIPVFPTVFAAIAAAVVGIGAYVFARRRR